MLALLEVSKSKKISLIYVEPGLGNAINPFIYCSSEILEFNINNDRLERYNGKDEPRHNIEEKITKKILNLFVKYEIIENNKDLKLISKLLKISRNKIAQLQL